MEYLRTDVSCVPRALYIRTYIQCATSAASPTAKTTAITRAARRRHFSRRNRLCSARVAAARAPCVRLIGAQPAGVIFSGTTGMSDVGNHRLSDPRSHAFRRPEYRSVTAERSAISSAGSAPRRRRLSPADVARPPSISPNLPTSRALPRVIHRPDPSKAEPAPLPAATPLGLVVPRRFCGYHGPILRCCPQTDLQIPVEIYVRCEKGTRESGAFHAGAPDRLAPGGRRRPSRHSRPQDGARVHAPPERWQSRAARARIGQRC